MADDEASFHSRPGNRVVSSGAGKPETESRSVDAVRHGGTVHGEAVGAPGAVLVIISGPSGVGKDTIIDALKHAETANIRSVQRIVIRIITGHDAPNDVLVSPGQKKRGIAVSVEWMPLAIEECFALDDQRRNPRSVLKINLPRKFDEDIVLTPRRHL